MEEDYFEGQQRRKWKKPYARAGYTGRVCGSQHSAQPWEAAPIPGCVFRKETHKQCGLCLQPMALIRGAPLTCMRLMAPRSQIMKGALPFSVCLSRRHKYKSPVSPSTPGSSQGHGTSRGSGHSRRHSLALSAVALLHGRSLKKGRHFSQSTPKVLCLQLHTSLSCSFFTHSLACPLHLHLGREETLRKQEKAQGRRNGRRRRMDTENCEQLPNVLKITIRNCKLRNWEL